MAVTCSIFHKISLKFKCIVHIFLYMNIYFINFFDMFGVLYWFNHAHIIW